eukprot:758153_1
MCYPIIISRLIWVASQALTRIPFITTISLEIPSICRIQETQMNVVSYNIQNYDCVDPRISVQYVPMDYDSSHEYLDIFDHYNQHIQRCGGNEPVQCDRYVTCMSNVSLQVGKIGVNDTCQIGIYQPTSVNYCPSAMIEIIELNATITLHCFAGTVSPTSTTAIPQLTIDYKTWIE